jgi:hypothetical protein
MFTEAFDAHRAAVLSFRRFSNHVTEPLRTPGSSLEEFLGHACLKTLSSLSDALSSREPLHTSLENAFLSDALSSREPLHTSLENAFLSDALSLREPLRTSLENNITSFPMRRRRRNRLRLR